MLRKIYKGLLKKAVALSVLLLACMLMACGHEQGDIINQSDLMQPMIGESQAVEDKSADGTESASEETRVSEDTASGITTIEGTQKDEIESVQLKQRFGDNCIAEQTFEVELSEYFGKVWFVASVPTEGRTEFGMQIMQDDKVLTEIRTYVPEALTGEKFTSLDAVSFYDVNYDNCTDILVIATYGNTDFAAVYYGFAADAGEYERYFVSQEGLSDKITEQVDTLTIPEIRNFLADGKRNGKFADYKEAYRAVIDLCSLEESSEMGYNLIYVDEDEIPELVIGRSGYYVNLYTYHEGSVYTLMNHWGYGAMGNAGYEYCPGENRLRNYNNDYAGAIWYATYMAVDEQHKLETVAQIETFNFDDVNENRIPDENEEGSIGRYSVSYIDGVEVSNEECAAWDAGDFQYIEPSMSLKELLAEL